MARLAHEEEWSVFIDPKGQTYVHYGPGNEYVCGALMSPARARLAAAAPKMARMLLRLEQSAGTGGACCPLCGGAFGHAPGCDLVALLAEIGVR